MTELSFGSFAFTRLEADRRPDYAPGPVALLAMLLLQAAVWLDMLYLHVTFENAWRPITGAGLPLALALYGQARRLNARLVAGCWMTGLFFSVIAFATALQYLFAIHGGKNELIDPILLSLDHTLGLDPAAFTALCDRSAILCNILLVIYSSLNLQLCLTVLALFTLRREQTFEALIISMVFLIFIGATIAACAPAIGFTGVSDVTFTHTTVGGGRFGQGNFLALRSGVMTTIDFDDTPGIITFPSAHAALGMLMTLVARSIPYAFWPVAMLNLIMLPGAVAHGGHYFVDLIAGIAICLAIWPLSLRLASWRPPSRRTERNFL